MSGFLPSIPSDIEAMCERTDAALLRAAALSVAPVYGLSPFEALAHWHACERLRASMWSSLPDELKAGTSQRMQTGRAA